MKRAQSPTSVRLFPQLAAMGAFLVLSLACGKSKPGPQPEPQPTEPTITVQPTDQTVYEGQPATFSVTATTDDGGTLTYQWLRQGTAIPVDGTSASFTTFPTTLLDEGAKFKVSVTNSVGTTTSSEVTLHQKPSFQVNPAGMDQTNYTLIRADDPNYYYVGRIDETHATQPVLIWSGTTVKAKFHGTTLGVKLNGLNGANYFNVIVDGEIRMLSATGTGPTVYQWDGALADTDHDLTIFKRTEAMFSYATFEGIFIDKAQTALGDRPAALPKRIEFYGDSITAGACDEVYPYNNDGSTYTPTGYSSHNNYTAYGAITARNINADYVAIACSGIGISTSWNAATMPDVYDRLYYKYDLKELAQPTNRYPFADGALGYAPPDIVVMNLGVNDYGKSSYDHLTFPATYVERYEALVQNVRTLYPDAAIVLTLGGLSTGSTNGQAAVLMDAFTEVTSYFASGAGADASVYSYVFQASNSANRGIHPRDYTHQLLADELTKFLRDNNIVQ